MKAIIFSGPSLPPSAIPPTPGLEWRPPLRQGDLHRAALEGPSALGVIDGVFETTPTVWHEEILFALDRGTAVYGAASIGALRAAELHPYGMQGVGQIFEWFRDGVLEDDEEVAVLHGPPELDFLPLSEAMVNVRASVADAIERGNIEPAIGRAIVGSAKGVYYKRRTWDTILEKAREAGLPFEYISLARAEFSFRGVNLKRRDALLLIRAVVRRLSSDASDLQL
jgi:hypothetical protein